MTTNKVEVFEFFEIKKRRPIFAINNANIDRTSKKSEVILPKKYKAVMEELLDAYDITDYYTNSLENTVKFSLNPDKYEFVPVNSNNFPEYIGKATIMLCQLYGTVCKLEVKDIVW